MKLTKFEHACFILEEQGKQLVVDPGTFTTLAETESAEALVITHEHGDHYAKMNVQVLQNSNTELQFFTTAAVASKEQKAITPELGQVYQTSTFSLTFFGGSHAQIHPDYPAIDNFGVCINNRIYYPGDSFTLPNQPVEVLLVPAAAPWMKTAEAMDFITAVKPKLVIPTHDAVLSDAGINFTDNWLKQATEKIGATYRRLQPGESLDL